MELADVADSKSADSDIVRVQVPLPAPDSHDGFDMKPSCFFYCSKSERYLVWNFIQYVSEHTEERCFVIQTAFLFYSEASAFFSVRFCLIFSAAAFRTVFWEKFLFDRKLYCLTKLSAFEVSFMGCFLLHLIFRIWLFHQTKISSYECGKLSEKKMLKTCPEDNFVL